MNNYTIISVICLITGVLISAYGKYKKTNKWHFRRIFLSLGIACVFADFFQFLSFYTYEVNCIKIPIAAVNAIKMTTFSINYLEIFNKIGCKSFCYWYFLILSFFAPFCWTGFIIAFFPRIKDFIRFNSYKLFKNICYFSELNENSFHLAKELSCFKIGANGKKQKKCFSGKKSKKYLCVFCGVSKYRNEELFYRAEAEGFITFDKQMNSYIKKINFPNREWIYFSISENQNNSLVVTKQILEKYNAKKSKQKKINVKLYLYSEQKEASLVIAGMNKKNIPVTIINRNRYIANDLMFRHPITEALRFGEKEIHALVIGAGKVGTEIIKNIIATAQLGKDRKFSITVFEKYADIKKENFYFEREELENFLHKMNIQLNFIQTELFTNYFMSEFEKIEKSVNYICICLGDDELNIKLALFLRRFYMRKYGVDNNPFIAVEAKNDIKSASVLEFNETDRNTKIDKSDENCLFAKKNLEYHFHTFGNNSILYSRNIIEDELEELAKNVHFYYEKVRSIMIGGGIPDRDVTDKSFYLSEFYMRAARARALHIASKLFLQKTSFDFKDNYDNQQKRYFAIKENIETEFKINLNKYSRIEHDRWVAFMLCEGWKKLSDDNCKPEKDLYRRSREKLHYCIQDSESLENDEKFDNKFKKYDEEIVLSTMKIIGCTLGLEVYQ